MSKNKAATTSGYGKVILVGEHAVVDGHPALAGAIDRKVEIEWRKTGGEVRINIPEWNVRLGTADEHPISQALQAMVQAADIDDLGLELEVTSTVPKAAGLGSSAALCVAAAKALLSASDQSRGAKRIVEVASAGESVFHGAPSGVDVAIANRGGVGLFTKKEGLKTIPCEPFAMVVGLTGEERSTAELVEKVQGAADKGQHFDKLGKLTQSAVAALQKNDLAGLGTAMAEAQDTLVALGASTELLDKMVRSAQYAGALGAKLTGAGGGGAAIALAPGREADVERAWAKLGVESFVCTVGGRG
jgi:mevalonate kinase